MKVCQALAQSGHSVQLLLPRWLEFDEHQTTWDQLAVRYGLTTSFSITWMRCNPAMKRNDFAWLAVRVAAQTGADLVYTWSGQSAVFALLRGIPVVFEIHDQPTGWVGPLWFRLFLALPGRKRLAVITRALSAKLQERFGKISDGLVTIAPNGVDLEQYAQLPDAIQARNMLGLPDAPTVLCSGHLYAGRGAGLFLTLARRFSWVSFIWVGGRPEDVIRYQEQAHEAGLKNITFTGFIPQQRLPVYQAAADILLMPYGRSVAGSGGGNSVDICSPMKMFDYLAVGRVILSSDLPVIHEILNQSNAVFAEPEDVDSWASRLEFLLGNSDRRLQIGRQALQDAQAYSWKARVVHILNEL